MDDLFGISMTTIMLVLLALLAVCLLSVAWVAWRRPVIFKLGVRNIPRRRAQTSLIVIGLMLSTMIIAAALGTGDTIDHSMSADVYDNLGHVDELVVASQSDEATVDLEASIPFDVRALAAVDAAVAGDANVDGVLPVLEARGPITNGTSSLAEPDVLMTGLDPARLEQFGGLKGTDGKTIDVAALGADGVVLSQSLAEKLDAKVGDRITLYYANQPAERTVAAIASDAYLGGARRARTSGLTMPGLTMPLKALQDLTGQPGKLTSIAVSNTGGVRDSLEPTDAVVADLRASLAGQGLGVDPLKQDMVDTANSFATVFTGLFLVLGLFSVAAGVLLIVLIFTMLASERRSEMGMERAVGAQRRQLIQQFIAEGSGYAIIAGMVGAGLGVLAALGIAQGMKAIFGQYVPIDPHVTLRSLVVAYCLGVVITFLTVVGSSWKISRLNIVAAVRDIPDVSTPKRKKMTLVWAALLLLAGAGLTLLGTSSGQAFPFMTGMSLLPFGAAMILRFFGVPGRPIFTIIGLYILAFWLIPDSLFTRIFGEYDGSFEMFFVSGIFMVIGATILIVNNMDTLLAGVGRLGGLFRGSLPAVRTAIAYPGAAKGRTGMTIAMFSLIIFSLVMIATMNQNFVNLFLGDDANAGWDVRADARGGNPITNFDAALAAQGVDTSGVAATGVTHNPSGAVSELRVAGAEDPAWKTYPVVGAEDNFLANSKLSFGQRAMGYATDADVIAALRSNPDLAVVDVFAVPSDDNFGAPEDAFTLTGLSADAKTFDPIKVELVNPTTGAIRVVTVIGIIDSKIGSLLGLFANQQTIQEVYGDPAGAQTSYYLALNNPDQAEEMAKKVEAALLTNGVQATSIRDELKESQKQSTGFLYIVEGFMGLGLLVGIAAVGVIAFRSVVERRQQIGVLRALGFRQSLVSLSFMIETAFVVGLGVIAGTSLGIVLARNLFTSDDVGSSAGFMVPWTIIISILVATVLMALLMTWIPSRQAARIAPAEALRYE